MPRVAILFTHFAPYHRARLDGAARRLSAEGFETAGIEVAGRGPFERDGAEAGAGRYRTLTLFPDRTRAQVSRLALEGALRACLDELRPEAVVLPGWGSAEGRAGLRWCRRRGARAVVMSETSRIDVPRRPWREWIKRRLVRRYHAALVGGPCHRDYLVELGFREEAIFLGYDVVDNEYFAREVERARRRSEEHRAAFRLPARYFMASCRFVPKKNLLRLLEAYRAYRTGKGREAWGLVVCGDGPLRGALEARIRSYGLEGAVFLPGFVPYRRLPAYYGLASAFIHASTAEAWGLVVNEAMACGLPVLVSRRCGSARTLVRDGENGILLDPRDPEGMAGAMERVTGDPAGAARMGAAAAQAIRAWGPDRFGEGLAQALREAGLGRTGTAPPSCSAENARA